MAVAVNKDFEYVKVRVDVSEKLVNDMKVDAKLWSP
jgi:hypothetical protein